MRGSPVADPVIAYVGIGANLGDAARAAVRAFDAIGELPGCRVTARSSLYWSATVDAAGPDYFNAVAAVATFLSATDLLAGLQRIEQAAGRERPYRHAPRTLDLDLLLYNDEQIETARLSVPHPRLNERAFVLVPLAEVAPRRVTAAQLRAVAGQQLQRV